MSTHRYSRTYAQAPMLSDVQTRALVEELAARMDNTNSSQHYSGLMEVLHGAKPKVRHHSEDACRSWYAMPPSQQYNPLQEFPAVKQPANLSSDEQDALDGLLMLCRPTDASELQAQAAFTRTCAHPDFQMYARQMSHLHKHDMCAPDSVQASIALQTGLPPRGPPPGRSFAAAAAAASRARAEYPIFFHHQPHRAPKGSSKRARQASPLYHSPGSQQEPNASGSLWPLAEGQHRNYRGSHQITSAAEQARHSRHMAAMDTRSGMDHLSHNDDVCANPDMSLGSLSNMETWRDSSGFLRTRNHKPVGFNAGFSSRAAYTNQIRGPQYPGLQQPARDDIERLAYAG